LAPPPQKPKRRIDIDEERGLVRENMLAATQRWVGGTEGHRLTADAEKDQGFLEGAHSL
jgi:hypothetical protein